jgi:hypothetical protein
MALESSAAPSWRDLRVGDRIVLLALPAAALAAETQRIYQRLVAEQAVLTVCQIDDWGYPVVEYEEIALEAGEAEAGTAGEPLYHWLSIDQTDRWQKVPSQQPASEQPI